MLADWPRALGTPLVSGVLKLQPEDFVVEEVFPVEFSEDGEFDWLWIEKCGDNTEYVARQLARLAGVQPKAVSYSGQKDRHAITRQWFCVHLPGKNFPEWLVPESESWKILRKGRHRQKLRLGSHRYNHFSIRLHSLDGDLENLKGRLADIHKGVPNYFGEQRFGRDGGNIPACRQWFAGEIKPGRFERSMYLSAARSFIFNEVLSRRVLDGSWKAGLDGDIYALRDSGSVFSTERNDETLSRILSGDIQPTGPLYGNAGRFIVHGDAEILEQAVYMRVSELCEGLLKHGLNMERRALRLIPQDFQWQFTGNKSLELSFSLPRGCFATALVRELISYPLAS
jgi:tRNA pseudouridine13 synthase